MAWLWRMRAVGTNSWWVTRKMLNHRLLESLINMPINTRQQGRQVLAEFHLTRDRCLPNANRWEDVPATAVPHSCFMAGRHLRFPQSSKEWWISCMHVYEHLTLIVIVPDYQRRNKTKVLSFYIFSIYHIHVLIASLMIDILFNRWHLIS